MKFTKNPFLDFKSDGIDLDLWLDIDKKQTLLTFDKQLFGLIKIGFEIDNISCCDYMFIHGDSDSFRTNKRVSLIRKHVKTKYYNELICASRHINHRHRVLEKIKQFSKTKKVIFISTYLYEENKLFLISTLEIIKENGAIPIIIGPMHVNSTLPTGRKAIKSYKSYLNTIAKVAKAVIIVNPYNFKRNILNTIEDLISLVNEKLTDNASSFDDIIDTSIPKGVVVSYPSREFQQIIGIHDIESTLKFKYINQESYHIYIKMNLNSEMLKIRKMIDNYLKNNRNRNIDILIDNEMPENTTQASVYLYNINISSSYNIEKLMRNYSVEDFGIVKKYDLINGEYGKKNKYSVKYLEKEKRFAKEVSDTLLAFTRTSKNSFSISGCNVKYTTSRPLGNLQPQKLKINKKIKYKFFKNFPSS